MKLTNRLRLIGFSVITTLITGSVVAGDIPNLPGTPTLKAFPVCFRHTCEAVETLSLTQTEWSSIKKIFSPRASNPESERRLISKAIAKMEVLIGPKIDTSNDKGGNLIGVYANGNQMDCIDESSNTTTYLALMQRDSLLKWHKVQPTKTRGWFIFGMPHTTAVIKENQSSKVWAVDSWFYDNGVEPAILPIAKWSDGWSPE